MVLAESLLLLVMTSCHRKRRGRGFTTVVLWRCEGVFLIFGSLEYRVESENPVGVIGLVDYFKTK